MIYRQFGKTIIITHETTVYTFTGEKEQRDSLIQLVEKFNNSKSDKVKNTLKNKILKLVNIKEELKKQSKEKEVIKVKAEKKLIKKKLKSEVAKNKDKVKLANDIETQLKTYKNENTNLKKEIDILKTALQKANNIISTKASVGISKPGES
jgi:cobalamin biosynthesis Mg chelatase CobN